MAALLRYRSLRFAVVFVIAVGWLALSNHCVLAGFESHPQAPAMHCHGSPAGSKPSAPANQSGAECCKVLRATLAAATLTGLPADSQALLSQYVTALVPQPAVAPAPALFEWDTGPPLSFAESVLQRSVLAHAPPFSV